MGRHSTEFKQAILAQMMPPNAKTVAQIQAETGVSLQTLYNWRRKALESGRPAVGRPENADAWSNEAKLAVVIDTATLNGKRSSWPRYCPPCQNGVGTLENALSNAWV